jgi:hypothetical protein
VFKFTTLKFGLKFTQNESRFYLFGKLEEQRHNISVALLSRRVSDPRQMNASKAMHEQHDRFHGAKVFVNPSV